MMRVEINERLATIKYKGSVKSRPGTFYGVEWDDGNGIHDGSDLFIAEPKSASFIPENTKMNTGIDFKTAYCEKYLAPVEESEIHFGGVLVETVGWEKMNNRLLDSEHIFDVGLSRKNIKFSSEAPCKNAIELDLTNNLFETMEEIAKITIQLSKLSILRLSGNRMLMQMSTYGFNNLKVLIMSKVLIKWEDFAKFALFFPKLEELCWSNNRLSTILEFPFSNLKKIDLDNNNISDWNDILILASTKIVDLSLKNNNLFNIVGGNFTRLEKLDLRQNNIQNWTMVNELNFFSSLTSIRFAGNPVLESVPPKDRMATLVGRIEVDKIEGTTIKKGKRVDYEIWLLQQLTKDDIRYNALVAKHGEPAAKVKNSLSSRIISVYLNSTERKVVKNMSVRAINTLLCNLTNTKVNKFNRVYWVEGDVELDNAKTLDFYNVPGGAHLILRDAEH